MKAFYLLFYFYFLCTTFSIPFLPFLLMALPFFYIEDISSETLVLDEDTSKHVTGVLRMKAGEELMLTDGKGTKVHATIIDDHRKRCVVKRLSIAHEEAKHRKVAIAVSLVKNASRFEWFLEKATEIGVSEIIPLLCDRTEKEKFRHDRMNNILVSAMLQSQQTRLPILHEPTDFDQVIALNNYTNKFIAHCLPQQKQSIKDFENPFGNSSLMLIGPEGDFTEKEIEAALDKNFVPVTLGETRLRTETAGMVAAVLLCI